MNSEITLTEFQAEEIRSFVSKKRRELGVIEEIPIANDIFNILENTNIVLIEFPIKSESNSPGFSALTYFNSDEDLVFIGVNTADYFDKQIFAIAHELYHYYTKKDSHITRIIEIETDLVEFQANRFAAEFLLPEKTLASLIFRGFQTSSLENMQIKTVLRFIARLQCTWWLPYRSLVKRLSEAGAISMEQYKILYDINERDLDGDYGRIGRATNEEIFIKLNTKTNKIGISPKEIDSIIRNFEDGIISDEELAKTLNLFNIKPEDFGIRVGVTEEDEIEFEKYFNEGKNIASKN